MNMKTIILIIIVILIAAYAFRSLYRNLTGKGGCSCGTAGAGQEKGCCSGGCFCCTHHHEEHK